MSVTTRLYQKMISDLFGGYYRQIILTQGTVYCIAVAMGYGVVQNSRLSTYTNANVEFISSYCTVSLIH